MKTVAQIGCRSFKDMSQVYRIFCNLIINYKFNEQRRERAFVVAEAKRGIAGRVLLKWGRIYIYIYSKRMM